MHINLLLISIIYVLFVSCKHEPLVNDPMNPNPTKSDSCDADTVYYVNDIQPLLNSNCAFSGCHDANSKAEGIDLSNYVATMQSDVIETSSPSNSELYEVITDSDPDKRMPPPPYAALNAQQVQTLLTWMQQGARNNSCVGDCDSSSVTYVSAILPIIQDNCQSCHNASNTSGGVLLTNYAEINAIAMDGRLLGTLTANGYSQMPPGGALDACSIGKVKKWINAGSPNN